MSKQEKTEKLVLPKEARYMMVSFLETEGRMQNVDGMDDESILKTYNELAVNFSQKSKKLEVSQETKDLNQYASRNGDMRLTDHDFIARLHKMNVPCIYLHLFKDSDADLTDKQLWAIVNKSGLSPINEVAKLTKMKRSPFKEKVAHV